MKHIDQLAATLYGGMVAIKALPEYALMPEEVLNVARSSRHNFLMNRMPFYTPDVIVKTLFRYYDTLSKMDGVRKQKSPEQDYLGPTYTECVNKLGKAYTTNSLSCLTTPEQEGLMTLGTSRNCILESNPLEIVIAKASAQFELENAAGDNEPLALLAKLIVKYLNFTDVHGKEWFELEGGDNNYGFSVVVKKGKVAHISYHVENSLVEEDIQLYPELMYRYPENTSVTQSTRLLLNEHFSPLKMWADKIVKGGRRFVDSNKAQLKI